MKNDILEHRRRVIDNICKSFGENIDIEKAHYHGEVHPNGKWYWNSQANRGRGDWRVIKKKTEAKEETKKISSKPIPEEKREIETTRKSFSNKSTLNKILGVLQDDKVHFEDGLAVAMDGNVLITMRSDYPEELENQTTDKNLKRVDTDFPNWKSITSEHVTGVYEDSKDVLEALEKIKDISDLSSIGIKVGNEYYCADYIYKILSIQSEMNLFQDKNDNLILRDQENLLFCFVTPLRKNISRTSRILYSPKDVLKHPTKEKERITEIEKRKIHKSEIDFNNVKYIFVGKESGTGRQGNYYSPGELGYVQAIVDVKRMKELEVEMKNGDFTKIKLPNNKVIILHFK